MKLEGDLRRSQRACQQLDTQKVIFLPAFSLVKCFGTQYDLPCIFFFGLATKRVWPGIKLVPSALEVCPLHWKCEVLTTGLPGMSHTFIFKERELQT